MGIADDDCLLQHAISTGSISDVYAATLVHMENPTNINLEDLSTGGKPGTVMLNRENFSQNTL